jgi:CRP-like cAMP-binding protein
MDEQALPLATVTKQFFFGFDGLVEDSKHLYSLWAEQDCHLFYITKQHFAEMKVEHTKRSLNEKILFLEATFPFNILSRSQLKKFI